VIKNSISRVRVIKSRRLCRHGYVVRMGQIKDLYGILVRKPPENGSPWITKKAMEYTWN
jgi:hypothetical protein